MVEVDGAPPADNGISSVGGETDAFVEAGESAPKLVVDGGAHPADGGFSPVGEDSDPSKETGDSAPTNVVDGVVSPVDGGISSVGGETDASVEAGESAPKLVVDGGAPPAEGGFSSVGEDSDPSKETGDSALDGGISSVRGEIEASVEEGSSACTKSCTRKMNIVSYLQEHGYSLRTLVAMSHGLKKNDGTLIFDITAEPFASMPTKAVNALASDYRSEVRRRHSYSHENEDPRLPRPLLWSIQKCQEWLDRHPIDDGGELDVIATEIEKYRILAEKAAADRKAKDEGALNGGKKWPGKNIILRMMHALVDQDEMNRAYLTRHRAYLTRQRQIAVKIIEKNKEMVDVLARQMAEIDEEIRVAEIKMLSATPVRNKRSTRNAGSESG